MSLPEKAFPVSWDQFHRDARALAWRLAGLEQTFTAIVCVTRGGLVPSAIISRELEIRLIPRETWEAEQRGELQAYWSEIFQQLGVRAYWLDI